MEEVAATKTLGRLVALCFVFGTLQEAIRRKEILHE